MKLLRWLGFFLLAIILLIASAWAFGALYFDGPASLVFVQAILIPAALAFIRPWKWKLGVFATWLAIILAWWLTLKPTHSANWQPDVAQLAYAEFNGDDVTIHNIRNCDYRSEQDFTPHWETRTVRLSQITGVDLALNYWGSPWMAHPIASFQFADGPPLCFSIETRKKTGQSYSAIGGLYRQFELIYIVADERDVIRVRTNYRQGEDVYLYRTTLTAAEARERFLEYLATLESIRKTPRWYNAITTNCTTAIRAQHPSEKRPPWDWRILLNGKADEMLYERRAIATGGLPFTALKKRALINPAAKTANDAADFSIRIRENRPGLDAVIR